MPGKARRGADSITQADFGVADGQKVQLYTLTNRHGLSARITNFGGIVTELWVPDRHGKLGDVVLGFDHLDDYLKVHPYFGALIGRVGNRIAGASFTLDGRHYSLAANDGPNCLHGGIKGFDKVVWEGRKRLTAHGPALSLSYLSPARDEGFPGNLRVSVTYILTDDNELRVVYQARTDRATPVNLTQHSYFNLACSGDILDHELTIAAPWYTPVDKQLIPTGEICSVHGTAMDFTSPQRVGARIAMVKGGYDHNYVLARADDSLLPLATVHDKSSGRTMTMLTTEPGVQLYTGNFLDGTLVGKGGVRYGKHAGLCLETQHFPDAVHRHHFLPVILRPEETYRQVTGYRFTID